jgi:hypothetical protein
MSEAIMNQVWNKPNSFIPNTPETNDLPPEILEEIDAHADTLSVPEMVKKLDLGIELVNLGLGLEKATDAKLVAKNKEIEALYQQLTPISEFLDGAFHQMAITKGDKINMTAYSSQLEKIRPLIPEKTRKLLSFDTGTYDRKELEHMCRIFTRHKDTEIAPKIERRSKEFTDIYKNMEQIFPMLRDIVKKYLDLQERWVGKQIPR